jgi:AraC-like DNA-binding protein
MSLSYHQYPADTGLARWVECAWSIESKSPLERHAVTPDACLDILYMRGAGLRTIGTMTAAQRFDFPRGAEMAAVRFHPGMAGRFLGIPLSKLTDRSAALEDLWPGGRVRELNRRLDDCRSIQECMRLLLGSLPRPDGPPTALEQSIEALTQANGDADLEWISRQANLSARQFRRRCLEESGLTPKRLCRVLRFRYARCLAAAGARPDWAAIAAQAGYFDQAHLIRDWREFTGGSPMAEISNTAAGLPD